VTKIRTVEAIAIEKFFVLGKWLPSLSKSIYFLLMTSSSRESIVSSFTDSILAPFSLLILGG
jgi:hypothetical protein